MCLKIHFISPKNVHDANSKILCTNPKIMCECRLTEINYLQINSTISLNIIGSN